MADYDYYVEIMRIGRFTYNIVIEHGMSGSDIPYTALTLAGARRKAKRIVARRQRADARNRVIDSWTVKAEHE